MKMLKIAATVAALCLSAGAQADLVVDLFNTDQAQISDNTLVGGVSNGGIWAAEAGPAGDILGGYRDLFVEKLSDGTTTNNTAKVAKADVSFGYLNFSTDSQTTGRGIVRWDGVGTDTTAPTTAVPGGTPLMGLGSKNLSPFTNFELLTIFSDQGFRFAIEIYTSATQWTRVTLTSNAHNAVDPGFASFIPLAVFDNSLLCGAGPIDIFGTTVDCGTGGTANLANVNAIQAIIDPFGGTTSVDLTLNQVTAIPEPASLALVGAGLFGAMGALRRRKAK